MAVNDFLQGAQLGAGIASDRLNRNLRMQELRSIEASRRMQEQQIAQNLQLQLEQNNMAIQYRADMTKAMETANLAASPIVPVVTPFGAMPAPNPQRLSQTDAAYRFVLPVIAKYEPAKVPGAMQDLAMAEYRQQAASFQSSEPEIRTEIDPVTKKEIAFYRTPRGWAKIPEDVAARQKLQNENQRRLATFKTALEARPDLVEFDSNGAPIISTEKYQEALKTASIDPGVRKQLEEKQVSSQNMFRTGRRLMDALPGNVGVPGFFKRAAVDFGLDKMIPGLENATDAFAAETIAKEFMAEVYKTLKSDSNITKPEQESILAAGPDPKGFKFSSRGDLRQLAEMLQSAGERSRGGASVTGKQITETWLFPEEIVARGDRGDLSPQEVDALLEKNGWVLIQSIRKAAQ